MHICVQVQWMEERLKASNVQSGYSDLQLFKRYQSLQASLHEKDELISSLEQQLEEQVSHIPEVWCTFIFNIGHL